MRRADWGDRSTGGRQDAQEAIEDPSWDSCPDSAGGILGTPSCPTSFTFSKRDTEVALRDSRASSPMGCGNPRFFVGEWPVAAPGDHQEPQFMPTMPNSSLIRSSANSGTTVHLKSRALSLCRPLPAKRKPIGGQCNKDIKTQTHSLGGLGRAPERFAESESFAKPSPGTLPGMVPLPSLPRES